MKAYIELLKAISIYFNLFIQVSDKLEEDSKSDESKETIRELKKITEELNDTVCRLLSSQNN